MSLNKTGNSRIANITSDLSFFAKLKGAIFLSGKTYSRSYKSKKLWHGYLVFIICIGLLSFVLSTSSFPLFTELFTHYNYSFNFLGQNINIAFSPQFFILLFLGFAGFWLGISFVVAHFKQLQLKRIASALGFAVTPLIILLFYLVNKYFLLSFTYELGPLLIGIGLVWSLLSGFIGLASLIQFDFGGLFNYATKSIIFRRKRTYTAIIGITVAIGLIVTPIPIVTGYYAQLNNLAMQNQYAEYLIMLENGKSDYYSSSIDSAILSTIIHSNIESISPETYLKVNLSLNTSVHQIQLRGINYSIFQSFRSFSFQILPSKSFSDDQLIIGSYLGAILNITYSELPVNVSLVFESEIRNITIIGLLISNIHYDAELFAPFNLTRVLNPELSDKFSLIEVKLVDPTLGDVTMQALQSAHPELDVKRENQLSDFVSGIIAKTVQSIWLLTIVIYIIMAFGMFHVMHTIIRDSDREITILKSIGSSRFQIIRLFVYQAALLCLIGSILGVLAGVFLAYGASIMVSAITTITVRPAFEILPIILAISLGLTSGVIGGFYPAYRASKMSFGGKMA